MRDNQTIRQYFSNALWGNMFVAPGKEGTTQPGVRLKREEKAHLQR